MTTKQLNIVSDWLKLFMVICGIVGVLIGFGWTAWASPKVSNQIDKKLAPIQKEMGHIRYIATKAMLLQVLQSTPEDIEKVDGQLQTLNIKPEE